jgi:hypothetical protein
LKAFCARLPFLTISCISSKPPTASLAAGSYASSITLNPIRTPRFLMLCR